MLSYSYLAALLATLGCLGLIDYRWRLVLWRNWQAGVLALAVGLAFFLAWDVAGIHLEVFYSGASRYLSGIMLARDLPLEEPFFLLVLCYTPLLILEWRRHV